MGEVSKELLLANCRIRSQGVGGSGTVLYSKEGKAAGKSRMVKNLPVNSSLLTPLLVTLLSDGGRWEITW